MHKNLRFHRQILQIVLSAQISLNFWKNLLSEIISHIPNNSCRYPFGWIVSNVPTAHTALSPADMCQTKKMTKTSSMNYGQWGISRRCLLYQCLTSSSIGYESYAIFECSTDTMGEISRTIFYRRVPLFLELIVLLPRSYCLSFPLRLSYILRTTMQKQSSEVFLDSHHFFNCHQNKNAPRTGQ